MPYKRLLIFCALFVSFFLAFLLIFTTIWIKKTFGAEVQIAQILFHIQYPITDTDPIFIKSFMLKSLMPSILLSAILSIPVPVWIRSISRLWHFVIHTLKTLYTLIAKSLSFGKKHTFALRVVTCLGVIVFATKFVDQRFQIRDFIAQNSSKAYGTFYETHYANPPLQEIATQFANLQNPRNLIVIFAESMESTYSAKSAPIGIGGGGRHIRAIWRAYPQSHTAST